MKMYLQIAVVHLTFWPFVIISLLCIHRSQHCWDAYCGLRSEKNSVLFLYSKKKTDFSPYFSFTLRRVQFHYNKKAKKADTLNGWSLQACILATTTSSPTNLPMSIPVIKIMVKCTLTRPTNITQACTNGGMPMSPFGPVLARLASTFRPFCGAGIIIYLHLKTKYFTKYFLQKVWRWMVRCEDRRAQVLREHLQKGRVQDTANQYWNGHHSFPGSIGKCCNSKCPVLQSNALFLQKKGDHLFFFFQKIFFFGLVQFRKKEIW